jgi:hypothetical protein
MSTSTPVPRARPAHDPAVFILGCDRSGTTLLRNLLASHPDLAITYEAPIALSLRAEFERAGPDAAIDALRSFPQLASVDPAQVRADARALPDLAWPDLVALVMRRFAAASGRRTWGDKTPEYWRFIPDLASMFPRAALVHIVRDPRAVARSWARLDWGPGTTWHCARAWIRAVGTARRDLRALPAARWCEVRYEDLVADAPAVLQRVCATIAVEFTPAMLDPARRSQHELPTPALRSLHARHAAPISRDALDAWRDLPIRELEHVEAACRELLIHYAYEPTLRRPRHPGPASRARYALLRRARARTRPAATPPFPLPPARAA